MVDFDKPLGWWCTGCQQRIARLDGRPAPLVPQHCNQTMRTEVCIPVFAVIPEGERPETEEPDEGTVCLNDWSDMAPKWDRGLEVTLGRFKPRTEGQRFANGYETGWTLCSLFRTPPDRDRSLADAVLWVAEAVLP
jgi:hypothetical protein